MSRAKRPRLAGPNWHSRYALPPAPSWRRGEWRILADVQDALGATLWRSVRDVRLWAETPEADRGRLAKEPPPIARERLAYAARQAPELRPALSVFFNLLRTPETGAGEDVAQACRRVTDWAEQLGLAETAIQFAEAAAVADALNARNANNAGRLSKALADFGRASVWYERGAVVALETDDKREYVNAHMGAGDVLHQLGRYEGARKHFRRAATVAVHQGLKAEAARAYHYLFAMAAEIDTLTRAEQYLRKSLRLYPLTHPRLPILALDFTFCLNRFGLFPLALQLLSVVGPLLTLPDAQLVMWANTARAAGGAGELGRFAVAERMISELAPIHGEFAAAAYLQLAEGAHLLGKRTHALQLAQVSRRVAKERGNVVVAEVAAGFEASIQQSIPPHIEPVPAEAKPDATIADMVARLQRRQRHQERRSEAE